ncbi:hypothetical protein BO221_16755 [Archangium sp. Cb G35]|uniref:hypothetical protein n=1 Tax=Archangium sp. Cb G35 TaxID=1920190 RepID=UPI0009378372|nr:hypothetical protein [Archangium sp. Cb G35]OJT23645.1 hypothetical protein BO221_16755 [Archangium sp. Cb G35]
MRRWGWAALAAAMCWAGCGEGGSLPTGGQGPSTNQDGTVDLPDIPPGTGQTPSDPEQPAPFTSLWPLTVGSTWTYRITDPVKGTFEKRVEVLGEQAVPETSMRAIAVRSTQPHLEELSWQLEVNGVVVRLREEDRKGATLARVTTWSPATVKSIATERPVGWRYDSDIRELTRLGDGSTEDKDKTYIWRVEAVNETVVTPAGTFTNVIRIKRERGDKENQERTYWLAPGIGKVKEDGERLEELVSYDVKKP